MVIKKFSEFSLSPQILKAITELGFEVTTPIQCQAIGPLLEGKDVIGLAMTGTGKTAAFAIPALETVNPDLRKPQVLVLCPTRELATQVAVEFGKLSKFKEAVHELPIYGGQPIERQIKALRRGPQIIVGTPGRVIDHLERKTLNLSTIKTVILDEADEMLNMGFIDDIEKILQAAPRERQTVLFSATMPKKILDLTKRYQKNPILIEIKHTPLTTPQISQEYFAVENTQKLELLLHLLEFKNPYRAIIFCNTKRMVDKLVTNLHGHGYFTEGLHGDIPQNKRNRIMESFRKGDTAILVATDVAARGIDVEDVAIVFNYDIPTDVEYYVHRIGRTGRAGKAGISYTFVHPREMYLLRTIEKYTNTKITRGQLPRQEDIHKLKAEKIIAKIKNVIQHNDLTLYKTTLEQTIGLEHPIVDIAAALFKMHGKETKKTLEPQQEPFTKDRPRSHPPKHTHRPSSFHRKTMRNKKRR